MKRIATILLIGICTLSSARCRAESVAITHDFNDMVSKGTLTFPNRPSSYAVGETELVTYTGSGTSSGTFDLDGSSKFQITLPNNGVMQTSPAVENLVKVQLLFTNTTPSSNVEVWISTDNSSWTEITSSAAVTSSAIDVTMPTKGNYFLKFVNKGAAVHFRTWIYYYEPCHCLRVVSE